MNLDKVIQQVIDEAIVRPQKLVSEGDDKWAGILRQRITDRLKQDVSSNPELEDMANHIGINPDFDKGELEANRKELMKRTKINPSVNKKIKEIVPILANPNVTSPTTGRFFFTNLQKMYENGETNGYTPNEIIRMKDFLDSQDLRYLYDKTVKTSQKKDFKFGIQKVGEHEFNYDNLDLNTIIPSHLSAVQDKVPNATEIDVRKQVLNKYMMSEYGLELKAPSFENGGNKKVKDALLINFTSAFRCPAWNECLVKHACYARNGEVRYYGNEKTNNDRKHLMWEAAHQDEELMKLVEQLLLAYVVNFHNSYRRLKREAKNGNQEALSFVQEVKSPEELMLKRLDELPQVVLKVYSEMKRLEDIRLNENGDFIGQWCIDMFDEIAERFKLIGVNTAAYCCRNLRFDKIKNIVINASRMEMHGPTVARYFYALPESMYNLFADTFIDKDIPDGIDKIHRMKSEYDGVVDAIPGEPLYYVDENGKKTPNGNYYYKCPCGREDFTMNGKSLKTVNCYQCHMCYLPMDANLAKLIKDGGKFFIFVKAHGAKANLLDSEREQYIINNVGVPESYEVNSIRDDGSSHAEEEMMEAVDYSMQTNGVEKSMQDEAFNTITDLAIQSVNDHLNGIAQQGNMTENFNRMYNRFFGNKLND